MTDSDRLRKIKIESIVLRDDVVKRSVNPDAVAELVDSIAKSGLNTPIRVRPVSKYHSGVRFDAWELIAGRHRIEAAKILGWDEIDANVEDIDDTRAEIAMHHENICRIDLGPADLAYASNRLKALYELLNPETRNGANQHSSLRQNGEPADRFTAVTAKATGRSERTIQRMAAIGKCLGDDTPKLAGTSLDTKSELIALIAIRDDAARTAIMERAMGGETISAKAIAKEMRAPRPRKDKTVPRQQINGDAPLGILAEAHAAKEDCLAQARAVLDAMPADWRTELLAEYA